MTDTSRVEVFHRKSGSERNKGKSNIKEWTFMKHTFCQIFRETAIDYAEKLAVSDGERSVTYQELEEYSNFLAEYLRGLGIRNGNTIAIQTGRTVASIIAMIGVWKTGACFVFLDDSYPETRNEKLKEDCGYNLVITRGWIDGLDWKRVQESHDDSRPEKLALLIYTSGTTSRPKGVMIEHRNLCASFENYKRLGFCEEDRNCVFANFGFVAAMYDIFATLSIGGSVVLIPEWRRRNIGLITEFLEKEKITVTFLPPHMARKLMEYDSSKLALRTLLVGSEAVHGLRRQSYRIYNVYAASELCALTACYEIVDARGSYPIGTLNENLKGYIVDEAGNQVEPGQEGELWLAGPQVSRGYLKRPDLTEKQYIPNPFSQEPGYERVFKTRDMVRQDEEGNLNYISRLDNMYKIRGFRVEGGAVESALLRCPEIKEAAVRAFTDEGGVNILCGYFAADVDIDVKKLKEELKAILPYYMIPTCFIRMESLPRNMNNKIDRNALVPPKELNDHKLLEKLY